MSLLYLDSSALVKLVSREPETRALFALLESGHGVVSSALARVEVTRTVARTGGGTALRTRARQVLARVALVAIDDAILDAAAELDPADLRSLDAIHLATAIALGPDLESLVSYDLRLNAAAESVGLRVVSPS